ncbi:MAG TPA: phosphate ABC transporter permease PstA [Thermoplasmata archaeon]|nr:phosphate ABC transporter permease PstA [Thermoplasmata archaeon]
MKFDHHARRKLFSHAIAVVTGLCVIAVLYPLFSIIYTAVIKGGAVLFQAGFLTDVPPNACSIVACKTVGIGPDIEGTFILVGLAACIAIPVGVLAAIFATEYRTRGFGRAISFTADVLTGAPSIIMGAFIFGYFVLYDPTIVYSAITGALALSAIMIPIITRTAEEALRTVPEATREAALALGISKWKATLRITLITALPGVATGALLAVMRAAGEAAPLLFTALGSNLPFQGFNQPTAALPLLIYNFALSPYSNQEKVAWGATLFLLVAILIANVATRYMIHRLSRRYAGM